MTHTASNHNPFWNFYSLPVTIIVLQWVTGAQDLRCPIDQLNPQM